MRRNYQKDDFPTDKIRKFLEPGPVVLVSSQYKGKKNIMTMNWHTMMEFSPALIGCVISASNSSYEIIRKSRECVINIPTTQLTDEIIGIGNCSGKDTDKFEKFNLTEEAGQIVKAPMIKECYANFECRIHDSKMISDYNFFILEVVKAHVAISPKTPKTLHYTGDATFMLSGKYVSFPGKFKDQNL